MCVFMNRVARERKSLTAHLLEMVLQVHNPEGKRAREFSGEKGAGYGAYIGPGDVGPQ